MNKLFVEFSSLYWFFRPEKYCLAPINWKLTDIFSLAVLFTNSNVTPKVICYISAHSVMPDNPDIFWRSFYVKSHVYLEKYDCSMTIVLFLETKTSSGVTQAFFENILAWSTDGLCGSSWDTSPWWRVSINQRVCIKIDITIDKSAR